MKVYKITYTTMTAQTIYPLCAYVEADSEEQAKQLFLSKKEFYSNNNPDNVVIVSIRKV